VYEELPYACGPLISFLAGGIFCGAEFVVV